MNGNMHRNDNNGGLLNTFSVAFFSFLFFLVLRKESSRGRNRVAVWPAAFSLVDFNQLNKLQALAVQLAEDKLNSSCSLSLSLSRCFFNETLLDVIRLQRRRKDSNRFPLFSLPSNYLSFKLTLIQFGISPTDFAWERKRVTSWKTAVYSTRDLWGQCRNLNSEIWALHLHINIKPKFNSIQF